MFKQAIGQARDAAEAALMPDYPLPAAILRRLIDFIDASLIDPGGRYFWLSGIASVLVLAIAYAARADWRARWGQSGFLRFCFPRGFFSHPSTRTDLKLNLANHMVTPLVNVLWRFNGAWFAAAIAAALAAWFGPAPHAFAWGPWTIAAFTLLFFVLDDFGYWVWHFLAHKIPFLWAFHKVHHSAEVLTPLVAGRVHPVEAMVLPVFRASAGALVVGPALYFFAEPPHVAAIFGMSITSALFAAAGNQLLHSHVPISWGDRLNRIFVSPATHQLHHSIERRHWDKNMGALLAVWDWIFGTLYLPDSRQKLTYGVAPDTPQPHPGLTTAWLRPFRDALPGRAGKEGQGSALDPPKA